MADVLVVGGGPAGLSAALFTAKNGLDTIVFDMDQTWMHKAHLFNYLGIESVDGSEFLTRAREQIAAHGAVYRAEGVEAVEVEADDFAVATEEADYSGEYVVLATGPNRDLAEDAGCDVTEEGVVAVSLSMETSISGLYATGAMVRAEEWQAIISAGDGATAALDILTTENGELFHDFDTPADVSK